MGRKQYWNSEAKNRRWIKDGRGTGTGSSYIPWLTVRDAPSEGRSHRVFGHLTQRTHQLLSDLELATFLLLQWRPSTTDIREQFPLDRDLTRKICERLGIAHPSHQGIDQYMSSDLVVDTTETNTPRFVIQVKSKGALDNPRTIEKLQIERSYWREKEVPFYLVTESQIPPIVYENLNTLYHHIDDNAEQDELMLQFEVFNSQFLSNGELRIIDLCVQLDLAYGHEKGESLYQLKRLLAQRYFHFDISKPFTDLRCSDLVAESGKTLKEVWSVSS